LMPIELKMPALSPTMESGKLARWLVGVGDTVVAGDVMAEIETDKATMEFEAVDEGTVLAITVPAGSEGVKVGTVIATIAGEGDNMSEPAAAIAAPEPTPAPVPIVKAEAAPLAPAPTPAPATIAAPRIDDARIIASPLAKRLATEQGIDIAAVKGSGPNGRIIKADVTVTLTATAPAQTSALVAPAVSTYASVPAAPVPDFGIPFTTEKLNNVRKVIARRLTEAKQTVPHIYLTVDIRLDALLALRAELNGALAAQGVKLSVNDLMIKALAKALIRVPQCNVSYVGDELRKYSRADISVAVAAPAGLITPIVTDAGAKSISAISAEMAALAAKARAGKLKPHEYQGGTASLSNLGMFGIKQFDAVINPPQAVIMAVGAGELRPAVIDRALGMATMMCATGSFDHRAVDGADAAQLMQAFRDLVETPLGLIA
jgi:pyruvate dehydrogenase E2 component (dihydrolipoamide acetyltransferase)